MEIIISKVRCAKPRTEKQLLNDQRLKEKFIDYHQQMKQMKNEEEPDEKEDIFDILRDIEENEKEIEILLKKDDEPIEEVIKKKRGRPRKLK